MSSKTKSSLTETPKATPAIPSVSNMSRRVAKSETESPSLQQSSRHSVDRSLQSVNSKPTTIDRQSSKVATPPEKPQTQLVKRSELQAQLSLVQEDLNKAKEQIALIEKEKAQAIEELNQARKVAEQTNEKLQEALVAQKIAEENSEIEKFRAVELEQAGIVAAQNKDEEWQKEVEDVRNQHALDVSALLSTTQELQRVIKQELAMITDARNQAMSHADDATKIAEIHAEKAEILSAELARMKALLDSKVETEANENKKLILKLMEEINTLKQQLKEAREQLNLVQEDLSKAKEQIALIEKEKAKAIEELNHAQKVAEEANKKLREVLVAQKLAEENSEIEKFRAVELEQTARKMDEEWQKEVEAVRDRHALDVPALLSTTKELQRVKQDLAMITDAKNQAMSHADDATKIAEIHAEKADILSAELTRMKALLDSKVETEASENKKLVLKLMEVLKLMKQVDTLEQELEKERGLEDKLVSKESSIEQLIVELEAAKIAESYAHNLLEELKDGVKELEMQLQEANKLKQSASESLDSVMKQLGSNNVLLHDAEAEIAALKEKMGLLETTVGRQKIDLEESECCLGIAKEEATVVSSTSAQSSSIVSFSTPAATASQPVFGNAIPSFIFRSSPSSNNDQINMEDTIAEDTVQATTPSVSVFCQRAIASPSIGSGFGSTDPSGGNQFGSTPSRTNHFQFGGQPNMAATQTTSPFQASGGEFNAGRSLAFGSGGGDKSISKSVKVRRNPRELLIGIRRW